MKSKLLLRIASLIMLLHAIGHTLAIITWKKPNGNIPFKLIQEMQNTHFTFQGQDATIAKFFSGHGYAGTILLLLIVTALWLVSSWENNAAVKICWLIGLSIVLLALDEAIFFFPFAVAFSLIAAALVFVSIAKLNNTK